MKKILSVILALAMVLALGVTAFAADYTVEEGKTLKLKFDVTYDAETEIGLSVADKNGFLTVGNVVVGADFVAFEITAPAGTAGKLANVVVTTTPTDTSIKKRDVMSFTVEVKGEEKKDPEKPVVLEELVGGSNFFVDEATNKASVVLGVGQLGITKDVYNTLKNANYETIQFQGVGYVWTLTRGDYTKMNVTSDIYFDVDVTTSLYMIDVNDIDKDGDKEELVEDKTTENKVLAALGSTQADVFYVTVDDLCNIANVASKPALVITVPATWINFSNKFSVNGYKFNGETATKVVEGLAVKPATNKLTLNLTAGGTYVFVADNYTVNPTAPSTSEKPNASTGANSAAAVVALAVMAVAAVASKKIVK